MIKKLKIFFDRSFWMFFFIGLANTFLSLALQYIFYNLLDLGYWLSSGAAYVICGIISFFLNKKYTFKNKDKILITAVKFTLVIAVCFFIAYSLAQPFVEWAIIKIGFDINEDMVNNIAIFVGQCIFSLLNYIGQRFFAFKNKKEDENEGTENKKQYQ